MLSRGRCCSGGGGGAGAVQGRGYWGGDVVQRGKVLSGGGGDAVQGGGAVQLEEGEVLLISFYPANTPKIQERCHVF